MDGERARGEVAATESALRDGDQAIAEAERRLAERRAAERPGGRRADDLPEWISASDYARIYGIDRATVYKWLRFGGILDTYRVGSLRRIRNIPPKEKSA